MFVWAKSIHFHFRLEKAIAALKPNPSKIVPISHFWTAYEKVAGEHDSEMVAQYA